MTNDWPVWVGPLGGALVGGLITSVVTYLTTRANWRRTRADLAMDRLDDAALALRTASVALIDGGWDQSKAAGMRRAADLARARAKRVSSTFRKRVEEIAFDRLRENLANVNVSNTQGAKEFVELVDEWLGGTGRFKRDSA